MAGAQNAWDRLKKSDDKLKKQREALKTAKYKPSGTTKNSGATNDDMAKAMSIAKSQTKQAQMRKGVKAYTEDEMRMLNARKVARKENSYDKDMATIRKSTTQDYEKYRDEGRSAYDKANPVKTNARAKHEKANVGNKTKSYAERKRNYERESQGFTNMSNKIAEDNRKKLEQAFREEKNGGKKVQLRNLNLQKKYGR